MRLLFFLLFLTLNIYSQRVIIDDQNSLDGTVIDSLNNNYILYYPDYYVLIDLETLEKKSFKYNTNGNLYIPIILNNKNYFISQDGGMVAVLENDTIKRIDRSYSHRMQNGSLLFVYNSIIHKYGGYGFWSSRNFFTYFDRITKEWEVVDPINSEEIPEGTSSGGYLLKGDEIYIFGGSKINPYRRKERIVNDEVWMFNLKDHIWSFLGTTTFATTLNRIKYNNKILFLATSNISEIDIINNKVTLYEHGLFSPRMSKTFFYNNKFYGLLNDKGTTYFQVVEKKDFLGKKLSSNNFYKNYIWWTKFVLFYVLIPALILFGLWLIFKAYKKRKKIIMLDNGLRFENKFTEFDQESMQIIKTLLSEKEVSSNQILNIVEKDQYSPAHNERLKVQKLNEINLKIKSLLGINEDVISSNKSKIDKRIKLFKITTQYPFSS